MSIKVSGKEIISCLEDCIEGDVVASDIVPKQNYEECDYIDFVVVHNNIIYGASILVDDLFIVSEQKNKDVLDGTKSFDMDELGVLKGGIFVINADDYDDYDMYPDTAEELLRKVGKKVCMVSETCVQNLWGCNLTKIQVLDRKDSDTIFSDELRPELIKQGYSYRKFHSGYQKQKQHRYHRAGTVVVSYKNKYGLLGFDDDQYFGVELPEPAKTVLKANKVLQPKSIRNKDISFRQGEWYFVKEAPPFSACQPTLGISKSSKISNIKSHTSVFNLPLQSKESKHHRVQCEGFAFQGDKIWIRKFSVSHTDHPTIYHNDWHLVIENLAVKSVSVEGVD